MKEKKISPNWHLATKHFLLSEVFSYIWIFLIGIFATVIIRASKFVFSSTPTVIQIVVSAVIITLIIIFIARYFGIKQSAKFLDQVNFIKDSKKVINIATIIKIVVVIILLIFNTHIPAESITNGEEIITVGMQIYILIFSYVLVILDILLFYFASKKYLKNNFTENKI